MSQSGHDGSGGVPPLFLALLSELRAKNNSGSKEGYVRVRGPQTHAFRFTTCLCCCCCYGDKIQWYNLIPVVLALD